MNKDEKLMFMQAGGTLLRVGSDKNGQAIIKQKTLQKDWHLRIQVPSKDTGTKIIEALCNNHSNKFKID